MRLGRPLLAVLLALGMLLSAGCRAQGPEGRSIALCLPPAADSWSGSLLACAKEAAQGWEGRLEVVPTPEIPGALIAAAHEAIELDVDIAVLYAFDEQEGEKAAALLSEEGIELILVGNAVPNASASALVTADHEAIGREAAECIASRAGGAGEVLVLEGLPGEATGLRNKGFEEAIAAYPDMTIVGKVSCGGRGEIAKSEMELALSDHPQIVGVFAHNDEMALGVIEALEAVFAPAQAVVGIGGKKQAVAMLMKNHRYLRMTFAYSPAVAADAVRLAISHLQGEPLPEDGRVLLPVEPIDPKNALENYDEAAVY